MYNWFTSWLGFPNISTNLNTVQQYVCAVCLIVGAVIILRLADVAIRAASVLLFRGKR